MLLLRPVMVTCLHMHICFEGKISFETLLSERWDTEEKGNVQYVDFTGLTKFQVTLILRHLYGVSNESLLDCFQYMILGRKIIS